MGGTLHQKCHFQMTITLSVFSFPKKERPHNKEKIKLYLMVGRYL